MPIISSLEAFSQHNSNVQITEMRITYIDSENLTLDIEPIYLLNIKF